MPYIIDGHNLIPKIGIDLGNIDDEVQLIQQLQNFARHSRKRVEVFFDKAPSGQAGRQSYGSVTAIFVRIGRTADAAILERVRSLGGDSQNWTVVSSDREVQAGARECGAKVVSSQAFAKQMRGATSASGTDSVSGKKVKADVDEDEIEYWLKQFSGE